MSNIVNVDLSVAYLIIEFRTYSHVDKYFKNAIFQTLYTTRPRLFIQTRQIACLILEVFQE